MTIQDGGGIDAESRASKIMETLTPSIRSAIAAELAVIKPAAPPPPSDRDRELLAACREVGAAVDRLEQHRFAGNREASARLQLEKAARRLRKLIARWR